MSSPPLFQLNELDHGVLSGGVNSPPASALDKKEKMGPMMEEEEDDEQMMVAGSRFTTAARL